MIGPSAALRVVTKTCLVSIVDRKSSERSIVIIFRRAFPRDKAFSLKDRHILLRPRKKHRRSIAEPTEDGRITGKRKQENHPSISRWVTQCVWWAMCRVFLSDRTDLLSVIAEGFFIDVVKHSPLSTYVLETDYSKGWNGWVKSYIECQANPFITYSCSTSRDLE